MHFLRTVWKWVRRAIYLYLIVAACQLGWILYRDGISTSGLVFLGLLIYAIIWATNSDVIVHSNVDDDSDDENHSPMGPTGSGWSGRFRNLDESNPRR